MMFLSLDIRYQNITDTYYFHDRRFVKIENEKSFVGIKRSCLRFMISRYFFLYYACEGIFVKSLRKTIR